MSYIVDSCVWIDFFNKKMHFQSVSQLLTDNLAFVNKIILAEIIPFAQLFKEIDLINCLAGLPVLSLSIDWDEIMEIQYHCLKKGINKLGLLDIAIAQNAKQNNIEVFSTNRHMILLCNQIAVGCKTS